MEITQVTLDMLEACRMGVDQNEQRKAWELVLTLLVRSTTPQDYDLPKDFYAWVEFVSADPTNGSLAKLMNM